MTPRERVLSVLNGKKPDKVPFTIYEGMIPQCSVERRLRNEGLCIVNRRVPAHASWTPGCTSESRSYSENGSPRSQTTIHTPVGDLTEIRQPADFTSWAVKKRFTNPEDYRPLTYLEQHREYAPRYEAYQREEAWQGEDIILRAAIGLTPMHEIMISWMGVETFSIEWAERRDEILKLEKIMRERRRALYPILANAPITHANYGGNEVPEVMGPPRFREFCVPCYEDCAEAFKPAGKLLGSHLDGNNRPWADLVAGSPLDYVEAFSPAPDTDMSLKEALEAWPDKVLWINFPSSLHLASLDVIRETTEEYTQLARETNRVIIGITENMPEERWQENLLAISAVINENPF